MKKPEWHFLAAVLLLAMGLRLFKVTNPVADWHAFRQADTASVSREYLKHGIRLLEPKYHDLSNIQSGRDNPQGYRMVEFPIVNALVAIITWLIPGQPLELVSRLVSIAFSLVTILGLYFLVKSLSGAQSAKATAIIMAILPFNIFYSRAVLPEPAMLTFLVWSLWWFQHWLQTNKLKWLLGSLLCLMVAVLLKPYVIFTAPVFLALVWLRDGWRSWRRSWLILYGVAAILPYIYWRRWMTHYPEGIPKFDWLFNGNGIRWRPAWWRWLGYERLIKLILGWFGTIPMAGNLLNWSSDVWVYGAWWFGMLAYLSVIATGNVQHDYYQVLLIPIIAISLGRGYVAITERWPKKIWRWLLTIILGLGILLSWQQVRGYFQVNHWEYVTAGTAVDKLTPPDSLVIAPAFGDTQFLFQTNRRGWPIGFEIEDKVEKGAEYYITTSMDDEANQLKEQYQTIEQTPLYLLLDLTNPIPQP